MLGVSIGVRLCLSLNASPCLVRTIMSMLTNKTSTVPDVIDITVLSEYIAILICRPKKTKGRAAGVNMHYDWRMKRQTPLQRKRTHLEGGTIEGSCEEKRIILTQTVVERIAYCIIPRVHGKKNIGEPGRVPRRGAATGPFPGMGATETD
jgi:hypothetical protein